MSFCSFSINNPQHIQLAKQKHLVDNHCLVWYNTYSKRGVFMDILMSLHKVWADMIFDGKKPIEFRTRLPKNFSIGDKIYIYETAKRGGSRKVVGFATVKDIIEVLSKDGRWPMFGAYPFIDFYFENIKGDKEKAEHYRKLKEEFDKYTQYKYGFILGYAFSELELSCLRETGCFVDTWKIFDMNIVRKVINDNTTSENYIRECDDWLKKIGYYNDCEESYYKYGIVLTNITKFDTPISINDINDKNGDPIKTAPQSWMYVSGLKGE